MIINIDILREHLPRTYRTITRDLDMYRPHGEVDIDLNDARLGSYTRGELMGFAAAQKAQPPAPPPPPPAAPAETPKPAEPLPPQIDFEETMRENERDLKARADEAAAKARADQYVDEQGLEPSQHNLDVITAWIRKNVKGYFSAAGIDAAIRALGPEGDNVLRWIPKTAAPTEPAGEVLADWQLPINADEFTMRRADVRALKDLLARRRAAVGYARPRGSFSSKF
jgi:hypothetical protein